MADDKMAVGREIDAAQPDEALKRGVARDLEAHLPASMVPGQATQEPMVESQREADNAAPGS